MTFRSTVHAPRRARTIASKVVRDTRRVTFYLTCSRDSVCAHRQLCICDNATYLSSPLTTFNISTTRRQCGRVEGVIDELIARLVANVGVDKAVAEKAVGINLDSLVKEGPSDKVQAVVDKLPGVKALIQAQQVSDAGGGMFGMGGLMGAGTKLMAAGLSMGQVQAVTKEVIAYSREKAGEDAVGEIVGAIPGLSQFV